MFLIGIPLFLEPFLVCIVGVRRCVCLQHSLVMLRPVIASSTLHAPSLYLLFIPYFFWYKLALLLLTSCLSSTQLYLLFQATLLPLTLTFVIFYLLLQLGCDNVHGGQFLFLFGLVKTEVLARYHGLTRVRNGTI